MTAGTPSADQPDAPELTWAPIRSEDVTDLSALLTAIEHLDDPSERHSIDALHEALTEYGADPDSDSRILTDVSGFAVGYGWVHPFTDDRDPCRVFFEGGVHPGWRGRGLGHDILSWQMERARAWYRATATEQHGRLRMIVSMDEKLTDRQHLVSNFGFGARRWFADLTLHFSDLSAGPPAVPDIPGIRLERYSADLGEDVRQAHNEAFADHWGTQPVSDIRWQEALQTQSARPDWSWVAIDDQTGDVAGYAMNSAYAQDWEHQGFRDGWTDRLGVRRAWRDRGVAAALLAASMRSFADAGLDAAGLGVDTENPTGAYQLYQRLGYQLEASQVMYVFEESNAPDGAGSGADTEAGTG